MRSTCPCCGERRENETLVDTVESTWVRCSGCRCEWQLRHNSPFLSQSAEGADSDEAFGRDVATWCDYPQVELSTEEGEGVAPRSVDHGTAWHSQASVVADEPANSSHEAVLEMPAVERSSDESQEPSNGHEATALRDEPLDGDLEAWSDVVEARAEPVPLNQLLDKIEALRLELAAVRYEIGQIRDAVSGSGSSRKRRRAPRDRSSEHELHLKPWERSSAGSA